MKGFTAIVVVVWLAQIAFTLDAVRRPKHQWVIADRDRGFWLSLMIMSSIFGISILVALPAYLFGVLPHFGEGQPRPGMPARANIDEFRRK